jgi:hypothetical protein
MDFFVVFSFLALEKLSGMHNFFSKASHKTCLGEYFDKKKFLDKCQENFFQIIVFLRHFLVFWKKNAK